MNEKEKSTVIEMIPCLGFYHIAGAIAKNCYSMHPFYKPSDVDKIIRETKNGLKETKTDHFTYAVVQDDFECLQDVNPGGFFRELNRILYSIPEFCKLNLSKAEMDAGITDPDDPERQTNYVFVTRYTHTKKDEEFIDLDACIRNIYLDILEECIDDEVADLRNKRFNQYPWLNLPKEDEAPPHKDLIDIETICGAIRGYFCGTCITSWWGSFSVSEMSKTVDRICTTLEAVLLSTQEEYYKKRSGEHLHFIGFDTLQDLVKLLQPLKAIPEFKKLNESGTYFSEGMEGHLNEDMAEAHMNEIVMLAILMRHPNLALSYLIDNGHVKVEERKCCE